jgi:hypothetical protein
MTEFDHGPSAQLAGLFDRVRDPPVPDDFWFDWGPVFYRGRLEFPWIPRRYLRMLE